MEKNGIYLCPNEWIAIVIRPLFVAAHCLCNGNTETNKEGQRKREKTRRIFHIWKLSFGRLFFSSCRCFFFRLDEFRRLSRPIVDARVLSLFLFYLENRENDLPFAASLLSPLRSSTICFDFLCSTDVDNAKLYLCGLKIDCNVHRWTHYCCEWRRKFHLLLLRMRENVFVRFCHEITVSIRRIAICVCLFVPWRMHNSLSFSIDT